MKIVKYVVVGGVQFVLDLCIFLALKYSGVHVVYSNITSRFLAAVAGFYMNKNFTFSVGGKAGYLMFLKYWLFWGGMTVVSTTLIHFCVLQFGNLAPLAFIKFFVEVILCFVGFLISRYWVYKHAK